MDLGDIVIYGGQRFYVRGIDPEGVHPRLVYLESVRTGEPISVAFERQEPPWESPRPGLRLVREDPSRSSTGDDPAKE